uniref:Uncharacterized protein n=1 Tax=Anguilla anguilla TaxID=7936 RepID=A0A0E9TLC2_ANGAN
MHIHFMCLTVSLLRINILQTMQCFYISLDVAGSNCDVSFNCWH